MKLSVCVLVLGLSGCASAAQDARSTEDPFDPLTRPRSTIVLEPTTDHDPAPAPSTAFQSKPAKKQLVWTTGRPLMQGFLGVSFYDEVTREGGGTADVDGDSGDLDELPLIGGGAQFKLGGERLDYGLEAFFSLEGRANAAAFAVGGGGAVVAVDVDLLIVDVYGGPFVSTFLGDKLRAYAGAGPLIQFANYDQDIDSDTDSGSGFGTGWYARTGLELVLPSRTMIGLGVRWSDSTIDLGGDLGDLDIEGLQAVLTVSRGI